MQPHDEIARWAIERYDSDPGNTRWYCEQGASGWWIMKYLLECYLYGQNKNLEYGGLPVMGLEKPVALEAIEARKISEELVFLLPLFLKAATGVAGAQEQIEIIKQVANPHRRGMPESQIRAFFDKRHRTEASLARAFKMVVWMGQVAGTVTPSWDDEPSILNGDVKLLPEGRRKHPLIGERVKNAFKRSNNTLESLAIGIYRAELKQEGVNLSERTLRADLAAYKEWEPHKDEQTIPVIIHTWNARGELKNTEERLIGFSTSNWKEAYRRPRKQK